MSRKYTTRKPIENTRDIRPDEGGSCPYCGGEGTREGANAFADRVFIHMRCRECGMRFAVVAR